MDSQRGACHGGIENGKLPVTYQNFEDWKIDQDAIAPAICELVALGFIEVTRKGYGGAAGVRAPSLYRLIYRPAWNAGRADDTGTHEYLKIKTDDEAEAIASAARKAVNHRNVERSKNSFCRPRFRG